MKKVFRAWVFLAMGLLLIACGQSVTNTPSPIPSPSATATVILTPVPSQTARAPIEPTSRPEHGPPILIPTIDPTLVPELLSKAFSVQTIEGVNGHKIEQITGWDYGFGGGLWQGSCSGFYWLAARHLLLYPSAGQVDGPEGYWGGIDVVPQPVVVNLESGAIWLPPVNRSTNCKRVYWSPELEILITSEIHDETSTVSTYTYDGNKLSSYPGHLSDISPSRKKYLSQITQ